MLQGSSFLTTSLDTTQTFKSKELAQETIALLGSNTWSRSSTSTLHSLVRCHLVSFFFVETESWIANNRSKESHSVA